MKSSDGQPEWRIVLDLIDQPVGTTIYYDALDEALGRSFRQARGPLFRAMKELEQEKRKTLVNVKGKGYRVVEGAEHFDQARHQTRKGYRRLRRSGELTLTVNTASLTYDQQRAVEHHMLSTSRMVKELELANRKEAERKRLFNGGKVADAQAEREE